MANEINEVLERFFLLVVVIFRYDLTNLYSNTAQHSTAHMHLSK